MKTVLMVYGTRPEAIKIAPLVKSIQKSDHLVGIVALTGQHRRMLDQVNSLFGISAQYDLDILQDRQTLVGITQRVLSGLTPILESACPDAVLVQGDTTTSFVSALAAFYEKIPVIHLEAGLRTGSRYDPYPEEMNRLLTTRLANLHLAPTRASKANLLHEGVPESDITVTGNTVIDALIEVISRDPPLEDAKLIGRKLDHCILVTSHRRESWGNPMANTARAIARIAARFPSKTIVLPAHLNPAVREILLPPLRNLPNIVITEPLSYGDMATVMNRASLVLTDSGGVQEEAPSLGKPVLVLRDTTERPEAIQAGTVLLVGTNEEAIYAETIRLLTDSAAYARMARAVNPYGDGRSSPRAVRAIEHFFGLGERPAEFDPAAR